MQGCRQEVDVRSIAITVGVATGTLAAIVVWARRAMNSGATPEEIASASTAAHWYDGVPGARLQMTRAIAVEAPPENLWPWLAQNGRGAGWYSWDRLDNGTRASAQHIVQWIPGPRVGDASAIGYLKHLEPGRELVWWAPSAQFLGARTWSSWQYTVVPDGDGSRLLMRVDGAAAGVGKWLVVLVLPLIDSIMALRQLRNLKDVAERHGRRSQDTEHPETGERDQYQLYQVIYASGDEAGVPGSENAAQFRSRAEVDGAV